MQVVSGRDTSCYIFGQLHHNRSGSATHLVVTQLDSKIGWYRKRRWRRSFYSVNVYERPWHPTIIRLLFEAALIPWRPPHEAKNKVMGVEGISEQSNKPGTIGRRSAGVFVNRSAGRKHSPWVAEIVDIGRNTEGGQTQLQDRNSPRLHQLDTPSDCIPTVGTPDVLIFLVQEALVSLHAKPCLSSCDNGRLPLLPM